MCKLANTLACTLSVFQKVLYNIRKGFERNMSTTQMAKRIKRDPAAVNIAQAIASTMASLTGKGSTQSRPQLIIAKAFRSELTIGQICTGNSLYSFLKIKFSHRSSPLPSRTSPLTHSSTTTNPDTSFKSSPKLFSVKSVK